MRIAECGAGLPQVRNTCCRDSGRGALHLTSESLSGEGREEIYYLLTTKSGSITSPHDPPTSLGWRSFVMWKFRGHDTPQGTSMQWLVQGKFPPTVT